MKIEKELFDLILQNMNDKINEISKQTGGKENVDTLALSGIRHGVANLKVQWQRNPESIRLFDIRLKFETQLGARKGVIVGCISSQLRVFLQDYLKQNLTDLADDKVFQIEAAQNDKPEKCIIL